MEMIWEGFAEACRIVFSGDALVLRACWRTLWISSLAVAAATVLGLPLGSWLARTEFRGRSIIVLVVRAGMAMPTVFVGGVAYALFSRRGPFGPLDLLYTPWAIIIGELLLAVPIVAAISQGAIKALDPRVSETAMTLGAGRFQRWTTYISEARIGICLAVLTAFARCLTELGIAMMVGGNIKGRTRTLATATALETSKGEFSRGIAMGVILLLIALSVTVLIAWFGRENKDA
jgi:tungstate transport system permease protein